MVPVTTPQSIESYLQEQLKFQGLTYVNHAVIGGTEVQLMTKETPAYRLGFLSNGGYALIPPTLTIYKTSDNPFTEADVLSLTQANAAAKALTEKKKLVSAKSCAKWPEGTLCYDASQITTDENWSESSAESICFRLRSYGFGGDRQVYPERTWVELTYSDGTKEEKEVPRQRKRLPQDERGWQPD